LLVGEGKTHHGLVALEGVEEGGGAAVDDVVVEFVLPGGHSPVQVDQAQEVAVPFGHQRQAAPFALVAPPAIVGCVETRYRNRLHVPADNATNSAFLSIR
jgi:hypothetical protein